MDDLPIADSETHRVANQYHGHDSLTTQFSVRINTVACRNLNGKGIGATDDAHCKDDSKPVNALRCAHAPKDQTARQEN